MSHKAHERATEWTHARTQEVGSIPGEKQDMGALTYSRQTSGATLQVHVGSDRAGDLLGRKSTTGMIVRRGKHLLRHMSCLQTLVALSSGEAEYYVMSVDINLRKYVTCNIDKVTKIIYFHSMT